MLISPSSSPFLGGYSNANIQSIYAGVSIPDLRASVVHLAQHFALSSILAGGYGLALMFLAAGPVWSGQSRGWSTSLAVGAIPAVLLILALIYFPTDHPYFANFSLFWLVGTTLAWMGAE